MSNDRSDAEWEAGRSAFRPAPVPAGERQVVWTIWLTYGAFYFCRTNISAAVPGMQSSIADGGLGLTGLQTGAVLSALKLAYGFGQLLNGQVSERLSPRLMLALGMFGSAGLNVLFGFSTGFYFLLFVWACNGYCQALGWTPCVRVVRNWVPVRRRGIAFGIIGTGYQITLGLSFFVAGQAAELLGWRAAMYVPACLLLAAGVFMLLTLREAPIGTSLDEPNRSEGDAAPQRGSWTENVVLTLSNPALWLLGISLGLLNACRYGFLDWGIAHLTDVQAGGVGKASLKYIVLAAGAVAGAIGAGWATDRFFGSRRAPVICILLVLLGVQTLVYESLAHTSVSGTVLLLGSIGFCIYGPQVLLVGTAPADLAKRGTAAAAAGFVNFMGYMGAASGDVVTGYVKDSAPDDAGWQQAIYLWAAWAFAAALCSALLWNATARVHDEDG